MTLYRALKHLSNGVRIGNLTTLPGLSSADISKLEQVGAISSVSAPPLDAIPEWRERAKLLVEHGIRDAGQLIEADTAALATACGVTEPAITLWKGEAAGLLVFHRKERV